MSDGNNQPQNSNEPIIIQTDIGSLDGQNKCPKCGATEISLNVNNGKLRCNFCRHEFEPEKIAEPDINNIEGQVIGSGAQDIVADTNDVLTFKCSSCGAEVVIDTAEATQARCHWCRNTLSVNQQIPNGSIPDVVLPFGITKDIAKAEIEKFVGKRKFFAHPKFKQEFTTDNIMGVYFPYMLVDVSAHSVLRGSGEKTIRKYYRGSGDNQKAYYDADLFEVGREFDLIINGLSVESSSDRLNNTSSEKTNNVINAIMPFDIENCVKWDANYLKGYTSEKRDTNVETLKPIVEAQSKDVARFSANESIKEYDRGVAWANEQFQVKGQLWKAAYLPVWLYSYQQVNKDKKMLHYVAVNARTKETMGSVPIHMPMLLGMSLLAEIFGILLMLFIDFDYNWIFVFSGFIFFIINFLRYRNSDARHQYETDTKTSINNLQKIDRFIKSKKGLPDATLEGANNKKLTTNNKINLLNNYNSNNLLNNTINSVADRNKLVGLLKDNMERKDD